MDEEPTLPQLPAVTWDEQTRRFNGSRKRTREVDAAALFANSSDPAVFSSDDDPALDNYVQGRRKRKKRYLGSWFAQHPTSSDSTFGDEPAARKVPKITRKLERQLDSGVWLSVEDTEATGELTEPLLPATDKIPITKRTFQRVPSLAVGEAESCARRLIRQCIEDGREDVDLS
jgi:hypothetical protein